MYLDVRWSKKLKSTENDPLTLSLDFLGQNIILENDNINAEKRRGKF